MTTSTTINKSQRRAAKVAGFAFLITFAIVAFVNFGIVDPLVVENNATETARNILANQQLFRIGITGNLIYCAGLLVLYTALYVILAPINKGLALLGTFWRLVWVLMWLLMTLNLFDALRLISGGNYLGAFEAERLQALGRFHLAKGIDYYYVGLFFTALASTLYSYLWLKSRYIPRTLAVLGIISSAFCIACTLIFFIFPHFDKIVNLWWFDMPMVIFDIALSFGLLLKGLRPADITEP
jgi:Domain of unknown function (DUF4386)